MTDSLSGSVPRDDLSAKAPEESSAIPNTIDSGPSFPKSTPATQSGNVPDIGGIYDEPQTNKLGGYDVPAVIDRVGGDGGVHPPSQGSFGAGNLGGGRTR